MRRWRHSVKRNASTPVIGLAIGAIFTCSGLIILIPRLGSAGIYWTLGSLIWTISCALQLFRSPNNDWEEDEPEEDFLKGFSDEENFGQLEEEEDLDPVTKHLVELQSLYVNKVLTRQEYEKCVREVREDMKEKDQDNGLYKS